MTTKVKATRAEQKKATKTQKTAAKKEKALALISAAPVGRPPKMTFAPIPAGFEEPGKDVMSRYRKPTDGQRAGAEDVAAELRRSGGYHADFGEQAPDPRTIADALVVAAAWDAAYEDSAAFTVYALARRAAAWDAALGPVTRLHARFEVAATDDSKLSKKYTKLSAFFSVREQVAARGAATRKKNTKSKKAAASAASNATTTTSTTQH
jgi:hypothetical protein